MQKRTIARIGIATGTAALCLGVSSPALACVVPGPGMNHATFAVATDPLATAIARADHSITNQLSNLDNWAKEVTNDPNLTASQKLSMSATIANAKAALQALKTQVDAATSPADVTTDLQSASVSATNAAVSLAMAIVHADDSLANQQKGLTTLAAKVTADPQLTGLQKTDIAAKIMAAQAQLTMEQNAVNAASSPSAVKTDLHSAALKAAIGALELSVAVAHADNAIDAAQAQLTSWAGQVAADPYLSADQKSQFAAKFAATAAKLTALKASINSATSASQVRSLLAGAHFFEQSWKSQDPSKMIKADQARLAAAKAADAKLAAAHRGNSTPNSHSGATTLSVVKPSGSMTIKSGSAGHDSSSNGHSHGGGGRPSGQHGR